MRVSGFSKLEGRRRTMALPAIEWQGLQHCHCFKPLAPCDIFKLEAPDSEFGLKNPGPKMKELPRLKFES